MERQADEACLFSYSEKILQNQIYRKNHYFKNESAPFIMYDGLREKNRGEKLAAL
jgi:hypothetical protein